MEIRMPSRDWARWFLHSVTLLTFTDLQPNAESGRVCLDKRLASSQGRGLLR